MSDEHDHAFEAYEDKIGREDQDDDTPKLHRCKFCNRGGFHWEDIGSNTFRLLDKKGKIHKCSKYTKEQ